MKTKENAKIDRYKFSCERGYDKVQLLAPYIGKQVESAFICDENTPQYLLGIKFDEIQHYWLATIRFWINDYCENRDIDIRAVKLINKKD